MQRETLLSIRNLGVGFRVEGQLINVLDDVSFNVNKGEILGIVGESGCGKSISLLTVMRLLAKNAVISGGEINFKGRDLLRLSEKEMIQVRGKEMAMIFQEPMTSLNPVYRIGDQILEMLLLHGNMTKKEGLAMALEKLKLVSIPDPQGVLKKYPHELSGGMRQRVMIAIAMACDPQLLIADEPTTALDVTIQAQILKLMKELKDKTGSSVILITHDLGVVAEMCSSVVVMYAGRVVEYADVISLFEAPAHPYTRGLLESLPSLNESRERLHTIKGNVPAPKDFGKGCRFAHRCDYADTMCFERNPDLLRIEPNHLVRCLNLKAEVVSNGESA